MQLKTIKEIFWNDAISKLTDSLNIIGPKVLLIDDSAIPFIEKFFTSSLLESTGFTVWNLLSNYKLSLQHITSDVTIVCLARASTTIQITELICFLLKQPYKVHFQLSILTKRNPVNIDKILLNVSLLTTDQKVIFNAIQNELCYKNVTITIIDLHIYLCAEYEQNIFSFCDPDFIFKSRNFADYWSHEILFNGIKQVFNCTSVTSNIDLLALGEDSVLIGKQIENYLTNKYPDNTIETSTNDNQQYHLNLSNNENLIKLVEKLCLENPSNNRAKELLQQLKQSSVNTASSTNHMQVMINENYLSVSSTNYRNAIMQFLSCNSVSDELLELTHSGHFGARHFESPQFWTESFNSKHCINKIIIADRACDWLSAVLTPLTYESLLKLNWNIHSNIKPRIKRSILEQSQKPVNNAADDCNLTIQNLIDTNKLLDLNTCSPDNPLEKINTDIDRDSITINCSSEEEVFKKLSPKLITDIAEAIEAISKDFKSNEVQLKTISDKQIQFNEIAIHERSNQLLMAHFNIASYLLTNLFNCPRFYELLLLEDDLLSQKLNFNEAFDQIIRLLNDSVPFFEFFRILLIFFQSYYKHIKSSIVDILTKNIQYAYGYSGLFVFHLLESQNCLKSSNNYLAHSSINKLIDQAPEYNQFNKLHAGAPLKLLNFIKQYIENDYKGPIINDDYIQLRKIKLNSPTRQHCSTLLIFPHFITHTEAQALEILSKLLDHKLIIITGCINSYRTFFEHAVNSIDKSNHLATYYTQQAQELTSIIMQPNS